MAAGSDLLDDVFFNTEVDEKVVSDLVGSLECELSGAGRAAGGGGGGPARPQPSANRTGSPVGNVHGGGMGLSQEPAKAGAGVQVGVINNNNNNAGSHGSSKAGEAGGASSAVTAAQSHPRTGSVNAVFAAKKSDPAAAAPTVAAAAPAAGIVVGKPAATPGQTLNGSNVVTVSHVPAVTVVNNGPKGNTIVQTSNSQNPTSTVISPQLPQNVPTVTLVRPPMQAPSATSSTVVSLNNSKQTTTQTAIVALKSPAVLQSVKTSVPTGPSGIRAIAPQVLAPRLTQPQQSAPNIQNIQLPPGMVLVRSESGQLLMIHQQTLAQIQAQAQSQSAMTPPPATPTSTPSVQITSVQAPGASLLARQATPNTIIKQGSIVQTSIQATTTLQRPPVLQNTVMVGGAATTPGQPLGTTTAMQPGTVTTTMAQRIGPPTAEVTTVRPTQISAETLENVKKCKNFLSTLIKLASSGKQSSETTANVKELVKKLLESKIEAEDFTGQLYKELNSSPQPYLVPFLKRSLPALRQMTTDSTAFIQQSLLPQPSPPTAANATTAASMASTALAAVVVRPPPYAAAPSATATKAPLIGLSQAPHTKSSLIMPQPHGAMVRPQVTLAQSPMVTLRGQPHGRIIMSQPQVVKQLPTAPVVKQTLAPGPKGVFAAQSTLTAAQKNKLKEAAGGTFRDDDDINDVASMAGVNLSEESARILATGSELVGAVTRSCKDEAFLSTSLLTRRTLEIGRKFGVSELGPEVVGYISHVAQWRLRDLLEKVSEVAQQRNTVFKEDQRHEQVSDVRAQLKFFEQLDQMEKQRKEDQEREILMKAAKSRSRQEDPEQLRLKQKAKEMQQQELAQIRQREANLTALAAIGPRKKRKTDSPTGAASAEGSGSGAAQSGGAGGGGGGGGGAGGRQFARQRITRVNLRDLLFCLENEREGSRSQLLYRGLLK